MNDESPKDYSRLYIERQPPPPVPSHRARPPLPQQPPNHHLHNHNQQQQQHVKSATASMDGAFQPLKHREQNKQALRDIILKLHNPPESCQLDASRVLNEHYKLCFQKQKLNDYRVLIRYPSVNNKPSETFAVKVESNTLRSIKGKLPIRGNYRFFFKTKNCLEEVESEDSKVPIYNERDGIKQIQLHLFERT